MSTEIGNIVFAAILFVFGIIYHAASVDIPSNMLEDPVGASGFPKLISMVVIGLSLILLVQAVSRWRIARLASASAASAEGEEDGGGRARFLKSALLFLTIVVFLALFDYAGYMVSVALLLLAVFLQNGTRFGWVPVVTAILGAVAFHLFFSELLGVRLPTGVLLPF